MRNAIWLIGFRAAGKTTVGRLLAKDLGWRFLDLDEELEKRIGCSILELVEKKGETFFRAREADLLKEIVAMPEDGLVVATGGGFVDYEPSFELVAKSSWPKAWLDPPAELLWERLVHFPNRRKIGSLSNFSRLAAMLKKRRPAYEKIATFRTESRDISDCLAQLKIAINEP